MANKGRAKKNNSSNTAPNSTVTNSIHPSSAALAEVIEETITEAVEEATVNEIQTEIAALGSYIDTELAPHRELLRKAERLSLNSSNAINLAKTMEERMNSTESQNATVVGKLSELDQSVNNILSEHQRFSRDSQVALEKASFIEQQNAVNTASIDALNATMASIGSRLEVVESQILDLTNELRSVLSSMASLRANINLTRRRGI